MPDLKYSFKEFPGPSGNANIAASDFNDAGQIVGTYNNETGNKLSSSGFLYDGSSYITLLPTAGTTASFANGINAAGQVVGSFNDANGTHGFIYAGGTYQTLDATAGGGTTAVDINASGQVAGNTFINSKETGYIYTGGAYQTIADPNAPSTTVVNALNASGQAVGYYRDASSVEHGFIYSGGSYTTVDDPNQSASLMELVGINASGVAIGTYFGQSTASFSYSAGTGTYQQIADPNGVSTTVHAIDDTGKIVGSYLDSNNVSHGFIYDNGTYTTVDDPTATKGSELVGINDAGQLLGNYDQLAIDPVFVATPLCFVEGTRIQTARGCIAVEKLAVGDLAVTPSGLRRPIRWIGHRTVDCRRHGRPHDVWPVRILAHAFGPETPSRDLYLSPGHPVLVGADVDGEGGHLVPIMCLVNGTTIERAPAEEVTYWHVELDAHDILLAEGLPAESYLDGGDRAFFSAAAAHALADPDFVVPGLAGRCRPVAIDGPVVEAERRLLDATFALRLARACAWPRGGPRQEPPSNRRHLGRS